MLAVRSHTGGGTRSGLMHLQSVDLTRLPLSSSAAPQKHQKQADNTKHQSVYEYSSREVSPPDLLLQQLRRAHRIFALHHGPSLADLFAKLPRERFCNILSKFWLRFALNWDVLLHGNPAVESYLGLKLAAGGELGIGVGEEEFGSGERDVLEDFVGRTEGLVDLIVSRFGDPPAVDEAEGAGASRKHRDDASAREGRKNKWMGEGYYPRSADGVVFSGVGAVSRSALTDVANWTECVYAHGDAAYGIRENPQSSRRKRRRRNPPQQGDTSFTESAKQTIRKDDDTSHEAPTIPPPIVSAAEASLERATHSAQTSAGADAEDEKGWSSSLQDPEMWMKYLTLGYGSSWGGSLKRPKRQPRQNSRQGPSKVEDKAEDKNGHVGKLTLQDLDPQPEDEELAEAPIRQVFDKSPGCFLVGLQGDVENEEAHESVPGEAAVDDSTWNERIFIRSLYVSLARSSERLPGDVSASSMASSIRSGTSASSAAKRLRVVIYVHQPFIFTFLFETQTASLTLPSFYRSIHHTLGPLQKPLLHSTDPAKAAFRHQLQQEHYQHQDNGNPIFDLIYDPVHATITTSIPNIPPPGSSSSSSTFVPREIRAAQAPPKHHGRASKRSTSTLKS